MATVSRETPRDYLASLLNTALVGTGKPCTAVYSYLKGRLDGESPVVLVVSGGILRRIAGQGTAAFASTVGLSVIVMVAEASAANSITEADVDDLVDDIEQAIAVVVSANQRAVGYWDQLSYKDRPSQPLPGRDLDGHPYIVEIISLEALTYD